jgi:MHS family proline/betaine transporter-like MFS transporter
MHSDLAPSGIPREQSMFRTVFAGLFGNLLEWFDYAVFGFLVGPIGAAFFPADNPSVQNLKAWGLFAVGFFARPIGGIVLGRMGDRKGRRWLLTVSVALIAVSTLVIGCLPTHAQIGWLAPAILVLCRLTQGFSLGGEFTGSMAYTTEHAKPLMRGLISSSTALGTSLGFLTGSAAVMVLDQVLSKDQIAAWGWRLPFLFSVVMALFGWWLRRSLHESEAGEKAKEIATRPPVFAAIAADWKPSLQLFAIVAFSNALYYYVFNAAVISAKAGDATNAAKFQTANTIALMFVAVSKVVGGWMSDRMGRRGSAILYTGWALAVMVPGWLAMTHLPIEPSAFLSAQLLMGIPVAMALGMQGAMLVEMFPVANRVVSMSFAYSVAMALSGGIMPGLDSWFTNELKMPGLTMVWIGVLGVLAMVVLGGMKDTTGRDLKA